jgi:hypothetical protein
VILEKPTVEKRKISTTGVVPRRHLCKHVVAPRTKVPISPTLHFPLNCGAKDNTDLVRLDCRVKLNIYIYPKRKPKNNEAVNL